jgi:hypothetical protein
MQLSITNSNLKVIKAKIDHKTYFRFFNIDVTIFSDTPEPLNTLKNMYQLFTTKKKPKKSFECYLIRGFLLKEKPCVIINNKIHPLHDDEFFVSHAHMLILQSIIDLIDNYLLFHAGVISKNGKGCIIAGPASYGKTTLILELILRGYKFLSDEFCPVKLSDYTIEPFPRSFGLRDNNPFLDKFKNKEKTIIKNLGIGKKVLLNYGAIKKKSIGAVCKGKNLILLRGSMHNNEVKKKINVIDLGLFSNCQQLVDELCSKKGIEMIAQYNHENYIVYRFSIKINNGLMKLFQETCNKYEDYILNQENVCFEKKDYSSFPSLNQLSKSKASILLLKHLRNRSINSKLMEKYNKKYSQILLNIGDFLSNIDCYEMKIGRLKDMADMVDTLYAKGTP